MYAHKITDFTGPDGVAWSQADEPSSGDGDVLVDVVAAGVSFADLLQTRGQYQMKVPVPYVPGMDAAGVVRGGPRGSRGRLGGGGARPAGGTFGRYRARSGGKRPHDGQPAVAGARGAGARAGVRRRRDPGGEGEPAAAGKHRGARSGGA